MGDSVISPRIDGTTGNGFAGTTRVDAATTNPTSDPNLVDVSSMYTFTRPGSGAAVHPVFVHRDALPTLTKAAAGASGGFRIESDPTDLQGRFYEWLKPAQQHPIP